ncbi:MAG TPA: aldo/keto reductase [Bacteroidales bacterium]|nr:aldo/keto reductase [Bacteroidales bacterium]
MIESKIGLGTVQFGLNYGISNTVGKTDSSEVGRILEVARMNGINTIDTASGYGESEKILGISDVKEFHIVSKYKPPVEGFSIKNQLNNSLNQLRIKALYGYLAHRPMDLLQHREQWEEMLLFREMKLVDKIGFSCNETAELELLLGKNFIPDIIQVPYNYFDKRFEPYFLQLKSKHVEIHTRSSFLQGLFFVPADKLHPYFERVKPLIGALQCKYGNNLSRILLGHCLKNPSIDKVIIGVNNVTQLNENLRAGYEGDILPDLNESIPDNIVMPSQWKL